MFRKITLFSALLVLIVSILGSYGRLSGAELGCPDWPTCYGQIIISDDVDFKAQAALKFPDHLLDFSKALEEMIHRYLMAVSALFLFVLNLLAWREKQHRLATIMTTLSLLFLAGLQAALDSWIANTHAMPVVVTGFTLLGMVVFWLLFWLYLRSNPVALVPTLLWGTMIFARFAMLTLFLQIVLGVWVSANQAGLACTAFPQCNAQWWPQADYQSALNLFNGLFTGYKGIISFDAQVAANWLHRVGALVCFILLSLLLFRTTATNSPKALKTAGLWLGLLLFMQIGLGIAGFKLHMPLWLGLVHHVVAVLLMLPLITINFYCKYGFKEIPQPLIEPQPKPAQVPVRVPVDRIAEQISVAPGVIQPAYMPPYVEPAAESLYLRLKSQLKRTRSGLSGVLANLPIGQKEINADLLEEIETSLLTADIGINVTTEIISHLTQSLERNQLSDGLALSVALKEELLNILKPCSQPLQIPKQDKPFVILVVGVNGAGKTTTIGKLANRLQAQGHSVMLAAGDTFRAAAVEQLQTWGQRNNIHVVAQHTGADSASVIYDGVQSAQAKGIDVLIADTAGRLHTKSNLMDELKKVKRIISKLDETAPHEVLLVLDAGTGQNALSQAKLFNETVALTGLVLTKLDGTAKGGVIFALAKQSGIPIRYIGIGEGIDDLQDFDAEKFVDALFVKD
ncbi:MAG: signal recognition particle-docking protein FtsY [Methylococcaceae bacterium]